MEIRVNVLTVCVLLSGGGGAIYLPFISESLNSSENDVSVKTPPTPAPGGPLEQSGASNTSTAMRLLCLINTTSSRHDLNALAVKYTWGRRCNILIFASDEEDSSLPAVRMDFEQQLTMKTKQSLKYVYERYRGKFDWVLRAEDSTYVIVENLRLFLSQYNPSNKLYMGCRLHIEIKGSFMSSRGGYVLSRGAVHALVEGVNRGVRCSQTGFGNEDIEMSWCLQTYGVEMVDTRDSDGRHRFLHYALGFTGLPNYLDDGGAWLSRHSYYPIGPSFDCCSDTLISNYYPHSSEELYLFEYLLYKVGKAEMGGPHAAGLCQYAARSNQDAARSNQDATLPNQDAARSNQGAARSYQDAPRSNQDAARSNQGAARSYQDAARSNQGAARSYQDAARSNQGAARSNQGAARSNQGAARSYQDAARSNQGAARSYQDAARSNQDAALSNQDAAAGTSQYGAASPSEEESMHLTSNLTVMLKLIVGEKRNGIHPQEAKIDLLRMPIDKVVPRMFEPSQIQRLEPKQSEKPHYDPAERVRLLCLVVVADDHEGAIQVQNTWGARCTHLVFLSYKEDPKLRSVVLNTTRVGDCDFGVVKEAFKFAYDNYLDRVDWVLKVHQYSYIVVDNLISLLSQQDQTQKLYVGSRMKNSVRSYYVNSEAGYVLSREAVKAFVEEGLTFKKYCRQDDGGDEDIEMGECLHNVGVEMVDTRDSFGSHTFLTNSQSFLGLVDDESLEVQSYYPVPTGLDCCSQGLISINRGPVRIFEFEFLLYRLRNFGMNRIEP